MDHVKNKLERIISKFIGRGSGKNSHRQRRNAAAFDIPAAGNSNRLLLNHEVKPNDDATFVADPNANIQIDLNLYMKMFIHELRTPISTISMGLDVLVDTTKDKDTLQDMKDSIGFMEDIFSKFAVIHDGNIVLNDFKAFSLERMTTRIVHLMEYHLNNTDIRFQCTIDPAVHIWNYGDKHNLMHCVINLLKNAIKYRSVTRFTEISVHIRPYPWIDQVVSLPEPCPPSQHTRPSHVSPYRTRSMATEQTVCILVSDNNNPILPHIKERLFEPFNSTSGSGLGLYICKHIVTLHGGTITHEFTSTGNQFSITLPLTMCQDPSGQPVPVPVPVNQSSPPPWTSTSWSWTTTS